MPLLRSLARLRVVWGYKHGAPNGAFPLRQPVFTQARRVVLTGLTPGTAYTLQVRAIGGSTGYSPWSEPVTHMAT